MSFLSSFLAGLSLALKQPLESYCDIDTSHGDALVTKSGHYVTWLRVDGMQRMAERKDFDAINEAMPLDLSGALETRGHAILGWYTSVPDAALVEIERLNLTSCRNIAREVGLDLHDILDERAKLWPKLMRWEAAYLILWTRTSVLTREERKQLKAEYAATAKELGAVGQTQRVYLRSEVMAARHDAFTTRVLSALRAHDIGAAVVDPHEALSVARSAMYREMSGSEWTPCLPGDRVMARCPEDDVRKPKAEYLLWPPLREQIFYADAVTQGGQRVDFGDNSYAPVDMNIGPEDPRPFVELAAVLGRDRIPWRASIVLEGSGQSAMQLKDVGASFLSMFPGNADLRRAFAFLREAREKENHIAPARILRDLGAGRGAAQTAPPHVDAEPAHRGLGQRQGHHGHWRPPGGGHEHGPWAGPRIDRQPRPGPAGRCAGDAALEPHGVALGGGQRAVPPAGRRHLALRSRGRPQAAAGGRHLRGAPRLG